MKKIIQLLRVKQYVKNLLIFAPIFFASDIVNVNSLINLAVAFVGLSLVASFVYILNDIKDIEEDKFHETKSKRPISSGEIKILSAIFIALICLLSGLFLCKSVYLYLYIGLNLLYIYKLREFALIDIVTIAISYVLRLFIGGSIANVYVSPWIIIMTFLLALFLAAAKRYDDLHYEQTVRKNITQYNIPLVESIMSILASVTIVAYVLYTLSPEIISRFNCEYLYTTSVFVILGIFRYLQITFVYKISGSPTDIIYKDWFLKISILLWLVSYTCIIYL